MSRSIKIGEKITDKVEVTQMFGKTLSPIFIILTSVSNHIIFSIAVTLTLMTKLQHFLVF